MQEQPHVTLQGDDLLIHHPSGTYYYSLNHCSSLLRCRCLNLRHAFVLCIVDGLVGDVGDVVARWTIEVKLVLRDSADTVLAGLSGRRV